MTKILLVAPNFDPATEISYRWSRKVKDKLEKENWDYIELAKDDATPENFIEAMKDVDMLIHYDHGNYKALGGQNRAILVDTDSIDRIAGKSVYAMACQSAKQLGVKAVENESPFYIGWKEIFIFATEPFDRLFESPANEGIIQLLSGKDTVTSNKKQKRKFLRNILMALLIPMQGLLFAALLAWDCWNLEYLGENVSIENNAS
jgi:hypothetical protein